MKAQIPFFLLSVILTFTSCTKQLISGNGSISTETREINNFTAITASGNTSIYINQGPAFSVTVKGSANLLPFYETKLVNNILHLGYSENVRIKNDNTEVFITLPVLNGLTLIGSGTITTNGAFNGNTDFNVLVSGSGTIRFSSGTTRNFFSKTEGSGNIYMLNMSAINAEATITGSGNTEITATSQLKVKINGSGNLYYRGSPVLTTSITGSGTVLPR